MTYYPNNSNGQSTSANSAPVVIASDQSSVPQQMTDLSLALKSLINVLVNPPWVDDATGMLKVETYGQQSANGNRQWSDISQFWGSTSAISSSTASGFSAMDSFLNPLSQTSWAGSIRGRIN